MVNIFKESFTLLCMCVVRPHLPYCYMDSAKQTMATNKHSHAYVPRCGLLISKATPKSFANFSRRRYYNFVLVDFIFKPFFFHHNILLLHFKYIFYVKVLKINFAVEIRCI